MYFLCLISSLTQIHVHMYMCCVCIYIATHMLYIYLKAVLFSYFITKILYHYFDLLLAMSVCHTALKSMKPEGD